MKRIFTVKNDHPVLRTPGALAGGLLLLVACGTVKGAETESVHPKSAANNWDIEALKRRGILSEQVDNLDMLSEIPKGSGLFDISLNGDFKGSLQVQISDRGNICFTRQLFEDLGLTVPSDLPEEGCYDWLSEQPGTSVIWQSESQTLSIVVPPSLLQQDNPGDYGGAGGHINYDYYSSFNKSENSTNRYSWLSLSSGINIANWIFHSQQNIQDNQGEINTTFSSTYAERYLSSINRIFQAGEINTRNTLFALGKLRGFQLYPDDALMRNSGSGIAIDGIANTPQARVEVRQYDQLIYSTLVSAGPFHLTNIPVENLNSELNVTVVETNGEKQQFIVPVTRLMGSATSVARGISLSFGKLKNQSNDTNIPAILTLGQNWEPLEGISLRTGTLVSGKYQSIAAALSGRLNSMPGQSFSLQTMLVKDHYQHKQSAQIRFYSSHTLTENVSLSLGASKNTPGYASIEEASLRTRRRYNERQDYSDTDSELSVGFSWNSSTLGTFSLTHSLTTSYPDSEHWRYFVLNWNRRFDNGLTLSTSAAQAKGGGRHNKSVNVNFSWPLGEKRFHHYYRSYNQRHVVGSDVSMPVGANSDFQLAVEETTGDHNRSIQTTLNNDLRYTNLSMSAQLDNKHQRNYGISDSGSVVAHSNGITFSNGTVQDTYGVLSLSQPLAGVPVMTPGGTAWTDWRGMAVIPSLTPWNDNAIDVDVDKLPKNIDINNGHRTLRPARGSVKNVKITIITGTRLLMTITLPNGQLLPKGSTLWDSGKIVAEAVDDGLAFISHAENEGSFHVKIAQSNDECDIHYKLNEEAEEDSLYEQLTLACK